MIGCGAARLPGGIVVMENIPMMESLFPDLEPSPRADCNVLFSGPDVSITVLAEIA